MGAILTGALVIICFKVLVGSQQECSQISTCELCAGIEDSGVSCRWCLETSSCVPSKYMCHSWKTVLHFINCPAKVLPTTYNDAFMRSVVSTYIHAANRVSEQSPVGAPMSCLMKMPENVQLLAELNVPSTLDSRTIGVLIGVNHDRKHIFVGYRSTNNAVQFLAQSTTYFQGWMKEFPLGGKMVAIYVQMYKDILNFGFNEALDKAVALNPSYNFLITGHSLGGALATVFSLHVALRFPLKQVVLYSVSAPRSGDETFVKLLKEHVFEEFRVVRDGDFVPDFPLRISHTLSLPHHNSFEIFYPSHMAEDNYQICNQPETEYCLKGSWWKKPVAHVFLFDQNLFNWRLGYCD